MRKYSLKKPWSTTSIESIDWNNHKNAINKLPISNEDLS